MKIAIVKLSAILFIVMCLYLFILKVLALIYQYKCFIQENVCLHFINNCYLH